MKENESQIVKEYDKKIASLIKENDELKKKINELKTKSVELAKEIANYTPIEKIKVENIKEETPNKKK